MIRIWSQLIGAFMLLFLAGGAATGSFFSDVEGATGSTFGAFQLESELSGNGLEGELCRDGKTEESLITIENVGGLVFEYQAFADNFVNENGICDEMELIVLKNNEEVYDGSLGGFSVGLFPLDPGEQDEWSVKVNLPYDPGGATTSSSTCSFDVNFLANQIGFQSGEAFFDIETISNTIISDTANCVYDPTVNLEITKAISGDSQGYELSDFSYRVTDNDIIDVVVPHNRSVALPEGIYTIEELVPEGFVKEDWRIGWYGQCDRGDTFVTTITIDEGNIDHGTLYCTADNQYRPADMSTQVVMGTSTTRTKTEDDTQIVDHNGDGRGTGRVRPPREQATTSASTSTPEESVQEVNVTEEEKTIEPSEIEEALEVPQKPIEVAEEKSAEDVSEEPQDDQQEETEKQQEQSEEPEESVEQESSAEEVEEESAAGES